MTHPRRSTAFALALLAGTAAGLWSGGTPQAATQTAAQAAKTLVYCSEGNPDSLNPQIATTTTGFDAVMPIYNTLVQFKRGTTEIVPGVAESWTVSDDGLTYLFTLREGVRFHGTEWFTPTRTLTADDVVFSIERQWKADHPFHAVSGGDYPLFTDMGMPDLLKSVEALDDRTVRIVLNQPEAPFLANLAMPFMAILSAEYAGTLLKQGAPERIDLEPVGTGPFRFVAYQRDVAIRYRAFDGYWEGRQSIDNLAFAITLNAAVRYNKLSAGECHVVATPSPSDLPKIKADPDLRLLQQEGLNVSYLAFNTRKPPFDDVRVRRAFRMAIDKRTIVDAVFQGGGQPAVNPIPPTLWSYNRAVEDYPYDPGEARRLLAEAGQAAGQGEGLRIDLWYMPVTRPYMPNARRVAEMMQADLEKIGVRATLKTAEWKAYREALSNGEHQAGILGWTGDNGDPDNFLYALLSCNAARDGGGNMAKWCDAGFDDRIERAKRTSDSARRTALYQEAQEIFREETPWLPIAHSVVFTALRKEVQGYRMDPFGLHVFKDVRLED
ncbi:ABC transporter substrate-binding protein [Azospirillum isscasi]|uniref:ABC transporter substrate-binding protein n=1 Tax=Azospirillum isscasi TaxID=3053926 RepID=A0ABU0WNT6_9PROT|nr:ABC transporter substrate-binding protein [Azospirillum isscasi]MDQ2105882.1 ABC transporter substrate-binding protein [Azospirillum isscasi]